MDNMITRNTALRLLLGLVKIAPASVADGIPLILKAMES